jgi:BMFP domain-containing protein YqiC
LVTLSPGLFLQPNNDLKGQHMLDPKQLDELTQRLSNLIPKGVKNVQADIEKNIRSVLQSAFAKMDLVTREEFDVQSAVLARTRAKLEALEKQVAALEQQLKKPE